MQHTPNQFEEYLKLNLSSASLIHSQIQIFSKGLKFTLNPKYNLPGMKKDIKYFTRKLRLVKISLKCIRYTWSFPG